MALLRPLTLTLLVAGCGDALVGGDYLGEPIFRFPAETTSPALAMPGEHSLTVGLFWSPQGAVDVPATALVEQTSESRRIPTPYAFSFDLRDAPTPALLHRTASGATWGIARILGYDDENENGQRDDDEPLTAAAQDRLLLYAPKPVSAEDSPTGFPLVAGYSLTSPGLRCRATPRRLGDRVCEVPLGDACRSDSDCGGGQCTTTFDGPWQGGACTIEEGPGACRPEGGTLVRGRDGEVWAAACLTTSDCTRRPAYQCDMRTLACLPLRGARIQVESPLELWPVCARTPP